MDGGLRVYRISCILLCALYRVFSYRVSGNVFVIQRDYRSEGKTTEKLRGYQDYQNSKVRNESIDTHNIFFIADAIQSKDRKAGSPSKIQNLGRQRRDSFRVHQSFPRKFVPNSYRIRHRSRLDFLLLKDFTELAPELAPKVALKAAQR